MKSLRKFCGGAYDLHMEPITETQLFEVFFAIGTDTWGRRLETRMVKRASTKEEAIEMVVAGGVAREAITGAGIC